MDTDPVEQIEPPSAPSVATKLKHMVLGKPRDLADTTLFHRLSLIPFLAWVGLGADGLSSSAYGPEEAYKALGGYTVLALALAALMATTVLLISAAYSRIIEEFPSGGGGYVVATKLLGPKAGVISGAALLVDYVLTITTSIAASGDALFSLAASGWQAYKLPVEIVLLIGLTALNIRGVRESVMALLPIFVLFLVTHVILIGVGIVGRLPAISGTVAHVGGGYAQAVSTLGIGGMLLLFMRAYSLGGGTYTGIEAVSNGLPIMREPRERTAKRTMVYMATSLAVTASGLLLCYLLWRVAPVPGKTLNAVLVQELASGLPAGAVFVALTLFSEGALLVVAAQAGFIDGPRVLANMAVDSWVPHRFAALSERLTTQNGILLMGLASLAALLYTKGDVGHLVVMYSINVFVTFSLSMFAMLRLWRARRDRPVGLRLRRLALFSSGFVLCATILAITVFEKFREGGWITLVVTGLVVAFCFRIRGHYHDAAARTAQLHRDLDGLPLEPKGELRVPDRQACVAGVLVGSYGGLGVHTVLTIFRAFPGHYQGLVFLSVGVIDSGEFKGEHAVAELKLRTDEMLQRYVHLAHCLGVPATYRFAVGTDAVAEAETLCLETSKEYPRITFFAGKLIFQRERWYQRLLHNETALALQKRLQWAGRTMVTLPVRVREA